MSGSATLGLEQQLLGHSLAFAPMVAPAQVWVALDLAPPAVSPSEAAPGTEVSGVGYTRMPATFALVATPANIAANTTSIEFPMAGSAWGTIGYFELWDSAIGGNRLYWGQLIDPIDRADDGGHRVGRRHPAVFARRARRAGSDRVGRDEQRRRLSAARRRPDAGLAAAGARSHQHDRGRHQGLRGRAQRHWWGHRLPADFRRLTDRRIDAGGRCRSAVAAGDAAAGEWHRSLARSCPLRRVVAAAVPHDQPAEPLRAGIMDFGAKGDGTTDDSAAIKTTIAAIIALPARRRAAPTGRRTVGSGHHCRHSAGVDDTSRAGTDTSC